MFALTDASARPAPSSPPPRRCKTAATCGRSLRQLADRAAGMHDNATAQVLCLHAGARRSRGRAARRARRGRRRRRATASASWPPGASPACSMPRPCCGSPRPAPPPWTGLPRARRAASPPCGLCSRDRLEALCRAHGSHVAIVNGTDQIVIGGARDALGATLEAARAAGAGKVTALAVGVPSHTPLLAGAVDAVRRGAAPGRGPRPARRPPPAQRHRRRRRLRPHPPVSTSWRGRSRRRWNWQACMEACRAAGRHPRARAGAGRRAGPPHGRELGARNSRALDDFRSLDGIRRWLSAD